MDLRILFSVLEIDVFFFIVSFLYIWFLFIFLGIKEINK